MKRNNMARDVNVLRYKKVCKGCEVEFMASQTQRYCEDCRKARNEKGRGSGKLLSITKVCENCNREYHPTAHIQKYCTSCRKEVVYARDLSYKVYRTPVIKCRYCHGLYLRTGNNQKMCLNCKDTLYSYRKIAFDNNEHVCKKCGYTGDTKYLDVHHKDRDKTNNSLDNLEILCKSCHHMEHIVRDSNTGRIITNK